MSSTNMGGVVTDLKKYAAWIHKRYQDNVVDGARLIYTHKYEDVAPEMGCLYWAAAFIEAAYQRGLEASIRVGSAQFQYRADSDGVSNTHFSYMFDKAQARARIDQGLSPEMHAWNYLPKTGEIVDLTTGFQEEQARRILGYEWEKEFALPKYFWGKEQYPRMVYHANLAATVYGLAVLTQRVMKAKL